MRSASSLTSSCGLFPPTVDTSVARGSMPSSRATQRAGIGVRPRADLRDGHDVDAVEQRRRRLRVGVGEAARVGEEVGGCARFGCRQPLFDLPDADDDG